MKQLVHLLLLRLSAIHEHVLHRVHEAQGMIAATIGHRPDKFKRLTGRGGEGVVVIRI